MKRGYMLPSQRNDWETPQAVFDSLHREFNFSLDVCATPENAKCKLYYTPQEDGLAQDWVLRSGGKAVWCNPPYRDTAKWIEKAHREADRGALVVMLIPARTDTAAWHEHIFASEGNPYRWRAEVRFLRGRLRFVGAQSSAPFPSAVVIFRPLL